MLSDDPEYILMSSELLPHDNIALSKLRSNHSVHESIQAGEGDLLPVLAHNLKLVNQPGEISFMQLSKPSYHIYQPTNDFDIQLRARCFISHSLANEIDHLFCSIFQRLQ